MAEVRDIHETGLGDPDTRSEFRIHRGSLSDLDSEIEGGLRDRSFRGRYGDGLDDSDDGYDFPFSGRSIPWARIGFTLLGLLVLGVVLLSLFDVLPIQLIPELGAPEYYP